MKLSEVPTTILVASGKGGVGKTTVASDLARTARDMGLNAGLIDADISTPNTPEVVGGEEHDIEEQRLATSDAIIPATVEGVQVVSQGHVLPDDVPVLRGGQFRAEIVADYIESVEWHEDTDVAVIDTPPGTGEELQTLTAAAPPDHAFVVTTPHPSSVRDATKTHEFFKQADVSHTAILNMAYIPTEDIAAHVQQTVDFTEVEGVGESTQDDIRDLLAGQVSDMGVFGHSFNEGLDFPVELAATIPYTEQHADRSPLYKPALRDVLPAQGVNV
jgi:Mrp family chromosome partitioning ATPase